jgi:Uma2 family endonuclease
LILDAKMKLYARYGVARYWIIDVDARTLEIHRLHAGEYVLDALHRADAVVPCGVPPGPEPRLAKIWPG